MKISIISKFYGSQTINTDTFNPMVASTSSTIFKVIEHMFNEWYDHSTQAGAPMGRDIKGMYNGEADQPAIYSKVGAIRQGIETLIEICKEDDKAAVVLNTRQIMAMDIESAFE